MNGPEPGLEIVPGLTLVRRLGGGGMGEAWLARDAAKGEVVAKLVPADAAPERLALLRREARLVRKLRHPGIVPVLGFQAGERFCAVTLRHMPGGNAWSLRGAPVPEVVRLGRELADALAYLHGLGVVHRDVKASNVLLDASGRAALADFGIASVARGDEDGLVVRGGGSRASMSPQQRAGAEPAPADDLYGLGVLLLELLTGAPPGETGVAASAHALRTLPIPERLRGLVASLVADEPEARPRSAAAARDELAAIEAELARAPAPERAAVRLQAPPRPHPSRGTAGGELFAGTRGAERSPVNARLVVLGALVVLAIGAVVWLPGVAERAAVSPQAASPAPPVTSPPAPAPPAPQPGYAPVPLADATQRRAETMPRSPAAPSDPTPREEAASVAEPATAAAVPLPEPTPDRAAEARALAGHRERGLALEAREDWRGALAQYQAALAIDPLLTFALEGRDRAEKHALVYEAIDAQLRRPERLSAAAVGREAEALVERALALQPQSPGLVTRIQALEKALGAARRKVAVVIESDGLTELSLSRVGPLGTVTRRSLELVPGTYTVTGSRRGYRDVRRQFSVAPGGPGPVVSLRCEEAL